MLDQNTDRMWYVIGAVIVGAALILLMNRTFPELFASVGDTFKGKTEQVTEMTDGIMPNRGNASVYDVHGASIQKDKPTSNNPVPIEHMTSVKIGTKTVDLHTELRGLEKDQDRLYLGHDGEWMIERHVGELVIADVEQILNYGVDHQPDVLGFYYDTAGTALAEEYIHYSKAISTHFTNANTDIAYGAKLSVNEETFSDSGRWFKFTIEKTHLSSLDKAGVQSWLVEQQAKGTPLTIYYALSRPTTEDVSDTLQQQLDAAYTTVSKTN